jgi:thiol-disulfide isomerase/thioredoxin
VAFGDEGTADEGTTGVPAGSSGLPSARFGSPENPGSGSLRLRIFRRVLWGLVILLIPLVLWNRIVGSSGTNGLVLPKSAVVGRLAPAVTGRDVLTGNPVVAANHRWRVVTFFATWCGPCVKEQPELVKFVANHRAEDDVSVISVIYQDDVKAVVSFERAHGGSWPVVEDSKGELAAAFGALAVPNSFVIDPAGKVVAAVLGGVNAALLDRILAKNRKLEPGLSSGSVAQQ